MSNITILDTGRKTRGNPVAVQLCSYTAGWEPAGAGTRSTQAGFAVWFDLNGARCGQRFAATDEAAARAMFARLTS